MKTIFARLYVIAGIYGVALRGKRGSSLVVVLAALGLLLVITVAFLASVSTELQTSKLYSNSSSLKLLTQSAANLVIGQVRVATGDPSLCWASQPGMIRTYNTKGEPAGYFKLYTDDTMQGSDKFDHTLPENTVPSTWYSKKGVYVDLNQPVRVNNQNIYPIIDGDSSAYISYSTPLETASVKTVGASGTPSVTGFWLKNTTPVDTTSPNLAPMPVKWLYVLQDGTYILPDSNTAAGIVTFTGAGTQPSASNPIIGRIAYWTDDETCKVNINTASEGSFWDMPRTYTLDDYYYAVRQPVSNEFQRYPGHPATVSLSAVFPKLATDATFPEAFYPITPRTVAGGSVAGTVDTTLDNTLSAMILRSDRLYSSTDEFLFQAGLAGGKRDLNSNAVTTGLDTDSIKRAKFFITAHSQAPDVNVFNLPRVSLWPITLNKASGNPVMTAYDKLIAYCSTINNHIFYFQRKDPLSDTVDLPSVGTSNGLNRNRQLLEYLRTLTGLAVPGFSNGTGITMAAKYSAGDRDQILTEMFDYIRCTNLQDATTGATKYTQPLDTNTNSIYYNGGIGQVVPIIDTTVNIPDTLFDAKPKNPRGFGRFPTVQQGALMFIGAGDSTVTPAITPAIAAGKQRVQAAFFLQMFDVSQGVAVTCPWYQIKVTGLDKLEWSADGNGWTNMGFPATGTVRPYARNTTALNFTGGSVGGAIDFRQLCFQKATGSELYPFISKTTGIVGTMPDMTTNGSFQFRSSSPIKIEVQIMNALLQPASIKTVQTVNMDFPLANVPVPPSLTDPDAATSLNGAAATAITMMSFTNTTISGGAKTGRLNMNANYIFVNKMDAIRAVVASPGDMRLLAARTEVDKVSFQPLASAGSEYTLATTRFSHMLRFGLSYPVHGAAGGRFVNVVYPRYAATYVDAQPISPNNDRNDSYYAGSYNSNSYWIAKDIDIPNQTGLTGITRDWDNGFQNARDGTYINKADEGDTGLGGTNAIAYYEMDYNSGEQVGDTFFSPNRMIPSAGMFGSLPSGVWTNKPWQTLLFRPGPASHPGLGVQKNSTPGRPAEAPYDTLPDHLFLDLFNMPVVEPYAISTPLATSGRINMNHLIVPFTYINRDTGLRAAMKAQKVTAISHLGTNSQNYKVGQNPNWAPPGNSNKPISLTTRFPINLDKTLQQFKQRFDSGDIFHTASEICCIDLVPDLAGALGSPAPPTIPAVITRTVMDNWWNSFQMTGDNSRERPYTNLYPLLTTKSNTYTVHMRVQTLKQVAGGNPAQWREGKDLVTGQYRGSQTIERYIDPNDSIPDYSDPAILSTSTFPPAQPLSQYYKFRTIASSQFAP